MFDGKSGEAVHLYALCWHNFWMKRILPLLLLLLAACSPKVPTAVPVVRPSSPAPAPPPASPALDFRAPEGWLKETPSNNMRKAQYRIADKEKAAADAELALFHFGRNPTGIQANIDRWAGQMGGADAKPEAIEGACKVTLVDLAGTYRSDGDVTLPEARMLAAVVETDAGPWYFKMVGPAATVGDWREEFVAMVRAARPR